MTGSFGLKKISHELRRRKVVRIAIAYMVVSFVIIQVAELIVPALQIPDWAFSLIVVLVGLGFPIALVLAWALEVTPDGVKRQSLVIEPAVDTQQMAEPLKQLPDDVMDLADKIDSVAVLPFVDLSPEQDQAYFVDGMTDALIGKLARVSDLRVISRTSVMRFKSSDRLLPEIAALLKVEAVVEGAVMRIGERVRIDAQLIDAKTDQHLWADSYEGDVADILALQSDVALTAARAIRETLSEDDQLQLSASEDIDPTTYSLYLKGRYAWNKCTEDSLIAAEKYFQQAIARDPGSALAYSGLGDTYSVMMFYNRMTSTEALPKIREAAEKAILLDDHLAEAHTSLAWAQLWACDFAGSEESFRRALKLNPNYAHAHHWYANLLVFVGRKKEAIAQIKKSVQLDPLSPQISNSFGWTLYVVREYEEAVQQLHETLKLDSEFANPHLLLSLNYLEMGDDVNALTHIEMAIDLDPFNHELAVFNAYVLARLGSHEQARLILDKELTETNLPARIAIVQIALGDTEAAFAWLDRAFHEQPETILNLKLYPWYDPLRSDPRFQALLKKIGLD